MVPKNYLATVASTFMVFAVLACDTSGKSRTDNERRPLAEAKGTGGNNGNAVAPTPPTPGPGPTPNQPPPPTGTTPGTEADEAALAGEWIGECGDDGEGGSSKESIIFAATNSTSLVDFYMAENCGQAVGWAVEAKGTIKLGGELAKEGPKKIDLFYQSVSVTPKNAEVLEYLNSSEACGSGFMSLNKTKAVTIADCKGLFAALFTPRYSIYRIDGRKLELGESAEVEAQRPTAMQSLYVYNKK